MGLKTTNYEVKELGITIPTAYAQITNLFVNKYGTVQAEISVQQTRDDVVRNNALEVKNIRCNIDKTKHIYTQVYNAAKEELFADWEDDIVDENGV